MAAIKLTELVSATLANPGDIGYLVQDGVDKKITLATLFGNLSTPIKTTSLLAIGGSEQVINNDGVIDVVSNTTILNNTNPSTLSIDNGTMQGQLKVIVSGTLSGTATLGSSTTNPQIIFNQGGQLALLFWVTNKWIALGGTAAISL